MVKMNKKNRLTESSMQKKMGRSQKELELLIEEEEPSQSAGAEGLLDTEVASALGPEITPLEVARIEIFSELVAFAKAELRDVATIEWEEIIYFRNLMVTPVLTEAKKDRSSSSRRREVVLSTVEKGPSRTTDSPWTESQLLSHSELTTPPKADAGRIDINYQWFDQ